MDASQTHDVRIHDLRDGPDLIDAVVQRCRGIGVARLYLSARPQVAPYYEKRGWQVIDREIGPAKLAILDRAISP